MSNTPWGSVPKLWKDEKSFLNWLRSQVRKVWSRHPVKNTYVSKRKKMHPTELEKLGIEVVGATAKTRVVRQCEMCDKWFPVSQMEVDHIHGGTGFTNYEEFLAWQKRTLFVGFDDIREICKGCHQKVTLSQRLNIPMSQVPMEQERIKFSKLNSSDQTKELNSLQLCKGKNKAEREAIHYAYLKDKYRDCL